MPTQNYREFQSFDNFEEVGELRHFRDVEDSWSVIVSDIRGSTKAIEAGRYKEVNLIGAATIVAIRNALEDKDFPFVFGGDGATILLPSDSCAALKTPLMQLQKMARDDFQFDLRIAIIPIHEIRRRGGRVLLSKYRMAHSATLAMIQGGGLRMADEIAKSPEGESFRLTLTGRATFIDRSSKEFTRFLKMKPTAPWLGKITEPNHFGNRFVASENSKRT